jgi:hypothetical protein
MVSFQTVLARIAFKDFFLLGRTGFLINILELVSVTFVQIFYLALCTTIYIDGQVCLVLLVRLQTDNFCLCFFVNKQTNNKLPFGRRAIEKLIKGNRLGFRFMFEKAACGHLATPLLTV